MKPLELEFAAFGPYRERQKIDFTRLSRAGLFLICGKTGAGKTVILDAMTYALYGKASGELRGDLRGMRCQSADPGDKTFTEFSFEAMGRVYRFTRSLRNIKKRDGSMDYSMEYGAAVQNAEGVFEPLYANPKAKELDNKAQELLGLTYHQFRQVVILPQGQFEQLLVANSAQKEQLLVSLFHAEKWQKAADYIYKKAFEEKKLLDREKEAIDAVYQEYHVQSTQELEAVCGQMEKESEEAGLLVKAAEDEKNEAFEQLEYHKRIDDRWRELEARQKEQDALLKEEDEIQRCRERLKNSRRVAAIRPYYDAFLQAREQTEKRRAEYEKQRELFCICTETMEKAECELTALKNQENQNEEKIGLIRQYEILVPVYEEIETAKERLEADEKQYHAAREAEGKAYNAYLQAREKRKAAEGEHAALCGEYARLYEAYYDDMRKAFARQLTPGEPCPICGSREHPEIYQREETDEQAEVTQEGIDQIRERMNACQETVGRRADREAEFLKAYEASQGETQMWFLRCQEKKSRYDSLCSRQISDIQNKKALLSALERMIEQTKLFARKQEKARDTYSRAREAYHSAQTAVRLAEEECQKQECCEAQSREKLEDSLKAYAVENMETLQKQLLEEGEQEALEQRVAAFETRTAALEQIIKNCRRSLKETVRPDMQAHQEALKKAETRLLSASNQLALVKERLEKTRMACKKLKKRFAQYEKKNLDNSENLVFAKHIRGDFGLGLQRYVLGVMLEQVIEEANRLLIHVHDGRYQLLRSLEGSRGSRKTGLDLEVFDSMSGGRRSVASLSGGEKFLTALALSLGLSAVVQAQSGGVRLGAMFIDEGFGSLDHSSIDDAMAVLSDINRSNGMVGIISHVDLLKETIPVKVIVDKNRDGSSLRISE